MLCSIRAQVAETIPFHAHSPHELIVCLSDGGRLMLENESYTLGAGCTFLLPGEVKHQVAASVDTPVDLQFICFDTPLLSQLGIFQLTHHVASLQRKSLISSLYDEETRQENQRLAVQLQRELDSHSTFGVLMARAILTQLLVNHLRCLQVPPLTRRNSKSFAIERCCAEILDNLSAPHGLSEKAKASGMSRSGFAVQFKQYTGMGLVEFIHYHRVQRAQRFLQESDLSVTEIAFALGFGNLGHFYTVFKKQVGMPPVEYREWARSQFVPLMPTVTMATAIEASDPKSCDSSSCDIEAREIA